MNTFFLIRQETYNMHVFAFTKVILRSMETDSLLTKIEMNNICGSSCS